MRVWLSATVLIQVTTLVWTQSTCKSIFTLQDVCEPSYQNVHKNLSNVPSSISCSSQCSLLQKCRSFLYSPTTGQCLTSAHTATSFPASCGTRIRYGEVKQVDCHPWLFDPCSTDADCPTPNSFCLNSVCKCQFGYSYDPGTISCVAECAEYGNEFTRQEGVLLYFNNHKWFFNKTFEECKGLCVAEVDFVCRSFDYNESKSSGQCNLSKETLLTKPNDHRLNKRYKDLMTYQRDCA